MQSLRALVSNITSDSSATDGSTLFMPLTTAHNWPLPPPNEDAKRWLKVGPIADCPVSEWANSESGREADPTAESLLRFNPNSMNGIEPYERLTKR